MNRNVHISDLISWYIKILLNRSFKPRFVELQVRLECLLYVWSISKCMRFLTSSLLLTYRNSRSVASISPIKPKQTCLKTLPKTATPSSKAHSTLPGNHSTIQLPNVVPVSQKQCTLFRKNHTRNLTSNVCLVLTTCCLSLTTQSTCFAFSSMLEIKLSKFCQRPSKVSQTSANFVKASRRFSKSVTKADQSLETSLLCFSMFSLLRLSACFEISLTRSKSKSNSSC